MNDAPPPVEGEIPRPPMGRFVPAGAMIGQSCPGGTGYDRWGNIKIGPVKVIEENHGKNFIKILIFQNNQQFFYGFQVKIERLVRQKLANVNDPPLESMETARAAAREHIIKICKAGHAIKKAFNDFTVIRYNQPELF